MREATLGGAAVLDSPRPRNAPSGRGQAPGSAKRNKTGWGPRLRRMRTRFALIVGSLGFSAIMVGIIVNATVMQKEHHPAPLFGTAPVHAAAAAPPVSKDIPTPPPAVAAIADPAPQAVPPAPPVSPVAPAPQRAAAHGPAHKPLAKAATSKLVQEAAHAHPRPATKHVDAIARLLADPAHGTARPPAGSVRPKSVRAKSIHAAPPVVARKDSAASATAVN